MFANYLPTFLFEEMTQNNYLCQNFFNKKDMKNKILSLAMLLSVFSFALAQENKKEYEVKMYTDVKDHLTHEIVPNVKGELLMASDSSFVDTLTIWEYTYNYNTMEKVIRAEYTVRKEGKYLMRIHADGYVTAYLPMDASKLHKRQREIHLSPVYLRKQPKRNEYELDEVVVKATKLKFYMDGDTLVYDADAFPMSEGSMLGDLLKQLPGVEVAGGVIMVNGKAIDAMLLNGKDFFDKDRELLLENMPSYMVKSFKAYERAPERVRGTAWEDAEEKELVMDVRLKREYSVGWIANAEAGGGTTFFNNDNGRKDGKYLGRLFGLRFTDKSRLAAFAFTDNLNDYSRPGDDGARLSQSEGVTSRLQGGINYHYEQDQSLPNRVGYEGSVDGTYKDIKNASHTSSATFLDNGNTFGKSFSTSRNYDLKVNTEHYFTYRRKEIGNLFKDCFMDFRPILNYQKYDNRAASASVTLEEDVASQLGKEWMDSITAPNAGELLKRYAINRTMSTSKGIGHNFQTGAGGYFYACPAYNDYITLSISLNGRVRDKCNDGFEHYTLDYPHYNAQEGTDHRNRYNPTREKAETIDIIPNMTIALDHERHHSLVLNYAYGYQHIDSNNPLYLLNRLEGWEQPDSHPLGMLPSEEEVLTTMDMDNSSRSDKTVNTHTPEISYRYYHNDRETSIQKSFRVYTKMNFVHEKMDYQQGVQIDTLMRRTTSLISGGIAYSFIKFRKDFAINPSYDFSVSAPSITSLLNVRNDHDPLNVTLGNPNLKNTVSHNARLYYGDKFGKTFFSAEVNGSLQTNAIAYGFIYDKETGVRTTKPQNVNGNWQTRATSRVSSYLGKGEKWRIEDNVHYDYYHSVDLAGTNAAMEATRSTVGSHYITDNFSLQYNPSRKMRFSIKGSLTYQHSTSNRESFQTLNVLTYNYGATAQLELPLGIQLSTDLTMYSRRGYSEPSMNTNELVWNARLAKKLMNGNMTLMFDGFDLLGNLSNVRRTINAQGRTETFYNVIPSYGLFHVIYRLNKQPKKKE